MFRSDIRAFPLCREYTGPVRPAPGAGILTEQLKLSGYGSIYDEGGSKGNNGIEFWKHCQDHGITENIMT